MILRGEPVLDLFGRENLCLTYPNCVGSTTLLVFGLGATRTPIISSNVWSRLGLRRYGNAFFRNGEGKQLTIAFPSMIVECSRTYLVYIKTVRVTQWLRGGRGLLFPL